jgi:hypothetical protein
MLEFIVGAVCTLISVVIGAALAFTSKTFNKEETAKRNVKG